MFKNVVIILASLVALEMGIAFLRGKGLQRIKGWRETSEEEKAGINTVKLSQYVSVVFFLLALILMLTGLNSYFRENIFKWAMLAWFVFTAIITFLFTKKSHLFHK